MTTKLKVYGLKKHIAEGETRLEYNTKAERDAASSGGDGWRKYTVTRTVRAKGGPLWWAIRQLQEGRAVVDAEGETWEPGELGGVCGWGVGDIPDWARSWTLAEVGS